MSLRDSAQKVGGGLMLSKAKQGGIHGNPASKNHPCEQSPTDTVTLTASVETYLPKPQPAKRVGRVGARFRNASPSELRQYHTCQSY